jgi:hypothetical protein
MRFVLYTSLQELAGSSWLQQHSLDTDLTSRHPHDQDENEDNPLSSPPFNHSDHDRCDALVTALKSFQDWTQELQTANAQSRQLAVPEQQQATAPSLPLVPHPQLLLLAEALQQAAAETAGSGAEPSTAAALAGNSALLCKALKKLANATETMWTAAAESVASAAAAAAAPLALPQPPTAAATAAVVLPASSSCPASHHAPSPDPAVLQAQDTIAADGIASATAAAVDTEGLKQLLFWSCHLTTAAHKVNSTHTHADILATCPVLQAVYGGRHAWHESYTHDVVVIMSQLSCCPAECCASQTRSNCGQLPVALCANLLALFSLPPTAVLRCGCSCNTNISTCPAWAPQGSRNQAAATAAAVAAACAASAPAGPAGLREAACRKLLQCNSSSGSSRPSNRQQQLHPAQHERPVRR